MGIHHMYVVIWQKEANIYLAAPGRIEIVALYNEGCNLPQGTPFFFFFT